jgi:hypothetical protein
VGLVGSKAHLLGEQGTPVHAAYTRPEFLRMVADSLREPTSEEIEENMYGTYYATRRVALFQETQTQPVEFVAKTFFHKEGIILGSPIYVALSDPQTDARATTDSVKRATLGVFEAIEAQVGGRTRGSRANQTRPIGQAAPSLRTSGQYKAQQTTTG